MSCDSPAAILVDNLGNAVDIYFDGSVYRLRTETVTSQLPTSLISGRLDTNIGSWLGSIVPTVGQKVMASSIPVVISSDQSLVPISGADGDVFVRQTTASNLNALVTQGAPNSIANKWPVQHTDGTNTMPTGDVAVRAIFHKLTDGTNTTAVKAASTAAIATDPSAVVALSPNSPLPAGTNIIGSLVANQTVNLNQVAGNAVTTQAAGEQLVAVEGRAASGAPVAGNPVLISGEDASGNVSRFQTRTAPPVGTTAGQVVRQIASQTSTTSSVASSATSVQLLATNTARLGAFIVNDSNKKLYVKCGTTASTTDYTKLLGAGEDWQVPFGYTGRIDGIWESASGNARLTEFT